MDVRTVRTKFFCKEVTVHSESPNSGGVVKLSAVNSGHPAHENRAAGVSLQGDLALSVSNPQTRQFFVPGNEYYVDFTPAPPTAT